MHDEYLMKWASTSCIRQMVTNSLLILSMGPENFCTGPKQWANVLQSQVIRLLWHRTVIPTSIISTLFHIR